MKLATKSVIPYFTIFLVFFFIFTIFLYKNNTDTITDRIIDDARRTVNDFAKDIAKSYPGTTMETYQKILSNYLNLPDTAYVVVISLDRNLNLPMYKEQYKTSNITQGIFSISNIKDYNFEKEINFSFDEDLYEISAPVIISKTYYKELSPKNNYTILSEKETKRYDFPEFIDQMTFIVKYAVSLKNVSTEAREKIKKPALFFTIFMIFILAIIYKFEERLLKPINRLITITQNLDNKIKFPEEDLERNDEIGMLSKNIVNMHDESLSSINNLYLTNEYAQSLISSPSISSLLNTIIFEIIRLKNIDKGGLLYWNEKRERFAVKESRSFNDIHKSIGNDPEFIKWFLNNRTILDPENFIKNFVNYNEGEFMKWRGRGIELIIPMIQHEKVVGFINLGRPKNKNSFSDEDKKFFNSLSQIAVMAVENLNLRLRQAQNLIIKKDLDFARDVQSKLLPNKMPIIRGAEFAIRMSLARNIGGDYYDFIRLSDGSIGVVIADVSGKGVSAALVMASTRSYLRLIARDNYDCSNVLKSLNKLLIADTDKKMFVTMFYSILDMSKKQLNFSNAGHNFPLFYKQKEQKAYFIDSSGFPLGMMDNFKYGLSKLNLESGDMLIYYTDGIIEAINYKRELFGFDKLEEMLNRYGPLGAEEFLTEFMKEFNNFIGEEEIIDDFTIMAIKIT